MNLKVEREKLKGDQLRYNGGLKALTGNTLLEGMNSLEQNYSNVRTPYLLILGSEDKLSNIDGSKVDLISLHNCQAPRSTYRNSNSLT